MNKKICTFYIVRHGQSEGNVQNLYSGAGHDVPLTQIGKQQAANTADKLKHIHFDAIFSSHLIRAKQTAEIIALDRKIAVKTIEALRERSYGQFIEGKTSDVVLEEFEELFEKRNRMSFEQRKKFKFTIDYESDEEVIARMITALREIAVGYIGKTVLIASHSTAMKLLLVHLGFAKIEEVQGEAIENAGYIKLKSDGIDFFVENVVGFRKHTK